MSVTKRKIKLIKTIFYNKITLKKLNFKSSTMLLNPKKNSFDKSRLIQTEKYQSKGQTDKETEHPA